MSRINKDGKSENLPARVEDIITDMTFKEEEDLQKFIEKDMPGLTSVTDDKIGELFSMYMKGKSYTELSTSLGIKKSAILFISKKNNWYEKKIEYLTAIQDTIQSKLLQTKIESAGFLTDIIQAYHKIMERKMKEALANGEKPSEFMDPKELSTYFRAIDSLEKLLPKPMSGKGGMNINIAGEARVEASEDGKTVNINANASKSDDVKQILAHLADLAKKSK
jgi:hypothetical protein